MKLLDEGDDVRKDIKELIKNLEDDQKDDVKKILDNYEEQLKDDKTVKDAEWKEKKEIINMLGSEQKKKKQINYWKNGGRL